MNNAKGFHAKRKNFYRARLLSGWEKLLRARDAMPIIAICVDGDREVHVLTDEELPKEAILAWLERAAAMIERTPPT